MSEILVNRPPAITWHWLKINETAVSVPELTKDTLADDEAINLCAPIELPVCVQEQSLGTSVSVAGEASAAAAFDQALTRADLAQGFESALGRAADEWITSAATTIYTIEVPENTVVTEPVTISLNAQDARTTSLVVRVLAHKGSEATLDIHVDSPEKGSGHVALLTQILVDEDAFVGLHHTQTLDDSWTHIENLSVSLAKRARFGGSQVVLGAAETYMGYACNLLGEKSDAKLDTRYLGSGARTLDFNYVMRQRGRNTTCTFIANGVLVDSSKKIMRDCIDLVHGCKGSVGAENETVLLASKKAQNKSLPVILCDEDDVQGAHGATIGHVNPEQLDYLQSRGLTVKQVEDLFVGAFFDYAYNDATTQLAKQGVSRLSQSLLGQALPHEVEE